MTTKTAEHPEKTCNTPACAESTLAPAAKTEAAKTEAEKATAAKGPGDRRRGHLPVVTPRADVWESADAAHLAIELPGVTHDDLDLRIESDRLTVRATAAALDAGGTTLAAEWRPRTYERTFLLTDDADRESIEAHLRHGLLLVTVPRRAERRPRSIPVRVASE